MVKYDCSQGPSPYSDQTVGSLITVWPIFAYSGTYLHLPSVPAFALECIDELTLFLNTKAKEIAVAVGSSGMVTWGVFSASAYRHWCQVRLTIVSLRMFILSSPEWRLSNSFLVFRNSLPGTGFGIARHGVADMIGRLLPSRPPLLRILNQCSNTPRRIISEIQSSTHYTINHTSGFSDNLHSKDVTIWQNWDKTLQSVGTNVHIIMTASLLWNENLHISISYRRLLITAILTSWNESIETV